MPLSYDCLSFFLVSNLPPALRSGYADGLPVQDIDRNAECGWLESTIQLRRDLQVYFQHNEFPLTSKTAPPLQSTEYSVVSGWYRWGTLSVIFFNQFERHAEAEKRDMPTYGSSAGKSLACPNRSPLHRPRRCQPRAPAENPAEACIDQTSEVWIESSTRTYEDTTMSCSMQRILPACHLKGRRNSVLWRHPPSEPAEPRN
ncbi:hypothetical protein VTN77DRAFT_5238 [Rasamsonia byssochlamydoides]|uniref:uncharacterized protein n=1 Tax=Rasamsonia byssochlamydoides TaxID=89139 RepID=UPI00374344DF